MKNINGFLDKFSRFSVSKYKKICFAIPLVIILIATFMIIGLGVSSGNFSDAVGIGIDFEGGTILSVRLGDEIEDNYEANADMIQDSIEEYGVTVSYVQKQVSSDKTQNSIVFRYKNISDDDTAIADLNEKIIASIDALYPELVNDDVNFITYEAIGATAAQDLLSKAAIAITVSTILILIYIIFRFTLVSGFAAVFALLHDIIILFALTIICRIQINTSFIAAVITIIAYSINNTIIIFDRCRENIKPLKGQKNINYNAIGDESVRSNMTRSIYTTLTTMVTIVFLSAFGSDAIREFTVPIILGLLAGLYSSVFLATPMWATMAVSYEKIKDKYSSKDAVKYTKYEAGEEEEIILTDSVNQNDDSDDDFGFKQNNKSKTDSSGKKKPVYSYKKKNTTFKKK